MQFLCTHEAGVSRNHRAGWEYEYSSRFIKELLCVFGAQRLKAEWEKLMRARPSSAMVCSLG